MLKVKADQTIKPSEMSENKHATVNDVAMVSHISHAMATKELGMTARTGYRTIERINYTDNPGMSKSTKTILWLLGIIGVSIGGYYVWSWVKRKKQVANVQTTQTTQGNNQAIQSNNQQQEVKALPPGQTQTLGSFNWAGFRHDVLNTTMSTAKDLLDYAIQQATQGVKK
jgi:hypothetical protein